MSASSKSFDKKDEDNAHPPHNSSDPDPKSTDKVKQEDESHESVEESDRSKYDFTRIGIHHIKHAPGRPRQKYQPPGRTTGKKSYFPAPLRMEQRRMREEHTPLRAKMVKKTWTHLPAKVLPDRSKKESEGERFRKVSLAAEEANVVFKKQYKPRSMYAPRKDKKKEATILSDTDQEGVTGQEDASTSGRRPRIFYRRQQVPQLNRVTEHATVSSP